MKWLGGPGEEGQSLPFDRAGGFLSLAQPTQDAGDATAGTGPRFRRDSRYIHYHIDDLDAWSEGSGVRGP
jgi:hypothetical protein